MRQRQELLRELLGNFFEGSISNGFPLGAIRWNREPLWNRLKLLWNRYFVLVFHSLVNTEDTMQLVRHARAACRTIACARSVNKRWRWLSKYKRYFVEGIYEGRTEEENWIKVVSHENSLVIKCYSIRRTRDEKLESIFTTTVLPTRFRRWSGIFYSNTQLPYHVRTIRSVLNKFLSLTEQNMFKMLYINFIHNICTHVCNFTFLDRFQILAT